jgi:Leucine-rich repeat (LRR) protein
MINNNSYIFGLFDNGNEGLKIYCDEDKVIYLNKNSIEVNTCSDYVVKSDDKIKYKLIKCDVINHVNIGENLIQIGNLMYVDGTLLVIDSIVDIDLNNLNNLNDIKILASSISKSISKINEKKYYCIFIHDRTIINITLISEKIIVDQIPINILSISKTNCIIYGSNALLINVTFNETVDNFQVVALTQDKYNNNLKDHTNDSIITIVKYDTKTRHLLSGDNQGTICLWKFSANENFDFISAHTCEIVFGFVNESINDFQFIDTEINTKNEDNNGTNLYFSISFSNKLFVIEYNYGTNCMNVKHCLDATNELFSKYHLIQDINKLIVHKISSIQTTIKLMILYFDKKNLNELIEQFEHTFKYNNCYTFAKILTLNEAFNPITLDKIKIIDCMIESSDNIVFKLKTSYYSVSKKELLNIINNYNDNMVRMAPVGIPSNNINIECLKKAIHGPNQLFEIIGNDLIKLEYEYDKINEIHNNIFLQKMNDVFENDNSIKFKECKIFLAICCAYLQKYVPKIIFDLLGFNDFIFKNNYLTNLFNYIYNNNNSNSSSSSSSSSSSNNYNNIEYITFIDIGLADWLSNIKRIKCEYWIDTSVGHSYLCYLYLKKYSNKTFAAEFHYNQLINSYFDEYGKYHFYNSTRNLRELCTNIYKIDETCKIDKIPRQIGYLINLEELYFRKRNLTGTIPGEICELNNLEIISLGNNQLSGTIPLNIPKMQNLKRLVLHNNNLEGDISFLNNINCIVNIANNPKIIQPNVSEQEKSGLIEFYIAYNGQKWTEQINWCSNESVSHWYKVGVLTGHVCTIVMANNNLSGSNMDSLLKLPYLQMIEFVSMPYFGGQLTPVCKLTTLQRLCIGGCNLTSQIPDSIGDLIHLDELQLFNNKLTGRIPNSIGNLTKLRLLSLGECSGGNNFTKGPIPKSLCNLKNLRSLFIAKCNLTGEIPESFGFLTNLKHLDLHSNYLVGLIPKSLSKLTQLSYCNIKNNKLNGLISFTDLINLTNLRKFSLSNNNFLNKNEALIYFNKLLPECKVWI